MVYAAFWLKVKVFDEMSRRFVWYDARISYMCYTWYCIADGSSRLHWKVVEDNLHFWVGHPAVMKIRRSEHSGRQSEQPFFMSPDFTAACFGSCIRAFIRLQCTNENYSYKLQPTRCNVSWIYLFLQTLYMFQAVPPPIIRSTQLYIHLFYVARFYCSMFRLMYKSLHPASMYQRKLQLRITANKMHRFLNLFIFTDALHVSGGSSAHHQDHTTVHTASDIVNQYCC